MRQSWCRVGTYFGERMTPPLYNFSMVRILSIFSMVFCFISTAALAESPVVEKEVGIVVLPPEAYQNEAKRMNREIHKLVPKVENKKNNFHVTLFHVRIPENKFETFVTELEPIIKNTTGFDIQLDPKLEPVGNQYLLWNVKPNSSLQNLHERVLHLALKYKSAPLARARDAYASFTDQRKKEEVDQYGVIDVLKNFQPHITLCYRIEASPETLEKILNTVHPEKKFTKFRVNKVGIVDLGYYGNAVEVLKTIQLKE